MLMSLLLHISSQTISGRKQTISMSLLFRIFSSTIIGRQQAILVSLLLHISSPTLRGRHQMMPMSLLPSHLFFNNQFQAADNVNASAPIISPFQQSATDSRQCPYYCSHHIFNTIDMHQAIMMFLHPSHHVFHTHCHAANNVDISTHNPSCLQ